MATNEVFDYGDQFDVLASEVTTPTGATEKVSGAAALVKNLPVVLQTDPYTNNAGESRITVKTNGVHELEVNANNGAVAVGDYVYATTAAASSLTLTNTSTSSTQFGYALGTVASGETTTIRVKIQP